MTSFETATTRLVQQELGACALIQDLLPLYMEHEVSIGSRDLITEHLARCERCAGFMAGARSMREQLRREGALRAGLAAQDQATRQAVALGQRRLRWLVLGGLCTLFGFGLIVVLVFSFFRNEPTARPGTRAEAAPAPADLMPGVLVDPPVEDAPIAPALDSQLNPAIPIPAHASPTAVPWPTPVPAP